MKARRSSSRAETPETETESDVEIAISPVDRSSTASTSAAVVVRPTSEPSKYMENVPAVLAPSEVASKRTMSESSSGYRHSGQDVRPVGVDGEEQRVRVEPGEGIDAEGGST